MTVIGKTIKKKTYVSFAPIATHCHLIIDLLIAGEGGQNLIVPVKMRVGRKTNPGDQTMPAIVQYTLLTVDGQVEETYLPNIGRHLAKHLAAGETLPDSTKQSAVLAKGDTVIENAAAASVRLPGDLVAAIDELFTVG